MYTFDLLHLWRREVFKAYGTLLSLDPILFFYCWSDPSRGLHHYPMTCLPTGTHLLARAAPPPVLSQGIGHRRRWNRHRGDSWTRRYDFHTDTESPLLAGGSSKPDRRGSIIHMNKDHDRSRDKTNTYPSWAVYLLWHTGNLGLKRLHTMPLGRCTTWPNTSTRLSLSGPACCTGLPFFEYDHYGEVRREALVSGTFLSSDRVECESCQSGIPTPLPPFLLRIP